MKTGIVVNNFDPKCKNRCQIRVNGVHTQTVGGKYVILDDDLPWALPAPSGSSSGGTYSVPKVGDRVYVDVKDNYNITYYGKVEIKGSVKDLINENADDNENMQVIAFREDYDQKGNKTTLKIYYLPEQGLRIECNDNVITMPKYDTLDIQTKKGAKISLDTDTNDITIHTDSKVNIDSPEVSITSDAEDKLILGSKLMELFNKHRHYTAQGESSEPIQQIVPDDFSKKITIG